MNKFGFLSFLFTLILLIFQTIPFGLYFGQSTEIHLWIIQYMEIMPNPYLNSYISIPINLFHYGNIEFYLWGVVINQEMSLWYDYSIIFFVFLTILPLSSMMLNLAGFARENETGQTLMKLNFIIWQILIVFLILGIPFFVQEALGIEIGFLEIYYYLNFGFYLSLFSYILTIIAMKSHPIK